MRSHKEKGPERTIPRHHFWLSQGIGVWMIFFLPSTLLQFLNFYNECRWPLQSKGGQKPDWKIDYATYHRVLSIRRAVSIKREGVLGTERVCPASLSCPHGPRRPGLGMTDDFPPARVSSPLQCSCLSQLTPPMFPHHSLEQFVQSVDIPQPGESCCFPAPTPTTNTGVLIRHL